MTYNVFSGTLNPTQSKPWLRRYSLTSCVMVRRWQIFGDFLHPVFSPTHV